MSGLTNIQSERTRRFYDADGNLTVESIEVDWDLVRTYRDAWLKESDLWMLVDRYNTLSEEQQIELIEYRQALRELPDYETANDAADNFPTELEWMI
jgi:hypothetical protein|tara:strand:- start:58 stop:348 length:291 start_codon:yes stop_codon:yes gene_type:complete